MKLRERSAQIAKPSRSNVTGFSQWQDEPFSRSSLKGGFAEGFVFDGNMPGKAEMHQQSSKYRRLGMYLLLMAGISFIVMIFIMLINDVLTGS